jgi:hypothetical protein
MNVVLLLSIGLGVLSVSACTVWFFTRTKAADLGSISRNWITEHRNDIE